MEDNLRQDLPYQKDFHKHCEHFLSEIGVRETSYEVIVVSPRCVTVERHLFCSVSAKKEVDNRTVFIK